MKRKRNQHDGWDRSPDLYVDDQNDALAWLRQVQPLYPEGFFKTPEVVTRGRA